MDLGLYNSCLLDWNLDHLFSSAKDNGYTALELHGGPRFRHVDWSAIAAGRSNPVANAQGKYGFVSVARTFAHLRPLI